MAYKEDYKILTWVPEDLIGKTSFIELLTSNEPRLIGLKGMLFATIMLALGGLMALRSEEHV